MLQTQTRGSLLLLIPLAVSCTAVAPQSLDAPAEPGARVHQAAYSKAGQVLNLVDDGNDLGDQINAAFASEACWHGCTVALPPGSFTYYTTINMPHYNLSLVGAGSGATTLNYDGLGNAIRWQFDPDAGTAFTIAKGGTLKGLTVNCNMRTAVCVQGGGFQGTTWEDLVIQGATNGIGILLSNIADKVSPTKDEFGNPVIGYKGWTERTYMRNVHLGSSGPRNHIGLVFQQGTGTDSFAYSDLQLWINTDDGSENQESQGKDVGIIVGEGVRLYHSTLDIKANLWGPVMQVAGQVTGNLNLFAEGGDTSAVHVLPTGFVKANGNVRIADFGHNQVVKPVVDPGGFFSVDPFVSLDSVSSGVDSAGHEARTAPPIQMAKRTINADGTIVVAQGHDLKGRLILNWPDWNNRSAVMIMDVACTAYAQNCTLNIPVNWAYQQYVVPGWGEVFLNPTIKFYRDSNNAMWPQIQVDVVNRNGTSPTLTATWYGTAGEQLSLLPDGPIGQESPPALSEMPVSSDRSLTANQIVCVKNAGPPLLLGRCTTIMRCLSGNCTCTCL